MYEKIKVNGVLTEDIRDVAILPEIQAHTSNIRWEGYIDGKGLYLMQLMNEPFTLEVDGIVYDNCRISDSSTGHFLYLKNRNIR